MASMMSRPKSRGCEVVKRTRRMPGISPTAASNSAKDFFSQSTQLPCRIFVRIHVLPEQLNFRVAEIGHLARFGKHRVGRPAALFPPRVRDHAVRTELVAPFNDRDVAAMRIGARGEFGLEAVFGLAVVEASDSYQASGFRLSASGFGLPCFQIGFRGALFPTARFPAPRFQLRSISATAVGRRSRHQRHIRSALENLFAFLLGHAAEHAKRLALLLKFLVIGEPVKNFLLRLVADRARVVQTRSASSTVSTCR